MRVTIGIKIFGIAVGLLILMAVVALLSMRMTRTVDDQLVIIDQTEARQAESVVWCARIQEMTLPTVGIAGSVSCWVSDAGDVIPDHLAPRGLANFGFWAV